MAASILGLWSVVGYLSLTDLGLTRSASALVSRNPAQAGSVVKQMWSTAVKLGVVAGAATAVVLLLARAQPALLVFALFPLLAALQFPLVGAMEARGRFAGLAVQKSLNAAFSYLVPAVMGMIDPFGSGLFFAALSIVLYRAASVVALSRVIGVTWRRSRGAEQIHRASRASSGRTLFWIGLSSVLGPAMLYADRLVLLIINVSDETWVFYVALAEVLIKTYIVPTAILSVLFPWMVRNREKRAPLLRSFFIGALPVMCLGLTVVVIVSAALIPSPWVRLGVDGIDTDLARVVIASLVVATLFNWVSQFYISLAQAFGRERAVGIIQIVTAPLYLLGLIAGAGAGAGAAMISVIAAIRVLSTLSALLVLGRKLLGP